MILVTGSLAFDQIMDFPGQFSEHILPEKAHMLNVSFLVKDMHKSFGGTAGNIAYSLSLLSIRTAILGVVGEDFIPYREFLEKNEIDVSYVKQVNSFYTSSAFGITDAKDNQIWGFYSGADVLTENLSIFEVERKIDFGIIAPNNPRAMIKFAQEYKKSRIPFLFDAGMQLPHLTSADLMTGFAGAKIIIGNDYEISVMEKKTGISNLHALAQKNKIIVTTMGEKGSRLSSGKETVIVSSAKVREASDPAGAGDAYRAGLVAGYLRGFPLKTCGQMGAMTAAYTVERYGTTTHRFGLNEFAQRYRDNFKEEITL